MKIDIRDHAKGVKALVLDGDGVIFTGHVLEGFEGGIAKIRSHVDGVGIWLLRSIGIRIACVTGESGRAAIFLENQVERWNNLAPVKEGRWCPVMLFKGVTGEQKTKAVRPWLTSQNLSLGACAVMGDDIADYHLLKEVARVGGFAVAPAQAERIVRSIVHWVTPRRGGDGAIRDLANVILEAKKIDVSSITLW